MAVCASFRGLNFTIFFINSQLIFIEKVFIKFFKTNGKYNVRGMLESRGLPMHTSSFMCVDYFLKAVNVHTKFTVLVLLLY